MFVTVERRRFVGDHVAMSDCWRAFDVAVGMWRLGEMKAERLPEIAVLALESGCDTPSLGELAGMDGSGWSEVETVVARVLGERGRQVPSDAAALKSVADDVLRQIVAHEIAAESGAARLRRLSMNELNGPAWRDLGVFHHLALDWEVAEGASADIDALRHEIAHEAQLLLDRGGVRAR